MHGISLCLRKGIPGEDSDVNNREIYLGTKSSKIVGLLEHRLCIQAE